MSTEDFTLSNAEAKVKISIVQSDTTNVEDFVLTVKFTGPLPEFIMSTFEVSPITCSAQDEQWMMKLPEITTLDISPVKMVLEEEGSFNHYFILRENFLFLKDQAIIDF